MELSADSAFPLFTIVAAIHFISLAGCLVGLDSKVDGDPSGSIFFSAWAPTAVFLAALVGLAQWLEYQNWFLLPVDSLLSFSQLALWLLAGAQLWIMIWVIPRVPFLLRAVPYLALVVAAFIYRG